MQWTRTRNKAFNQSLVLQSEERLKIKAAVVEHITQVWSTYII